jgi:hypothetical protein
VPGKEEEEMVFVQGGFLEVQPDHINVLSDTAIRAADLDEAKVLEAKKQAEEAIRARSEKQEIATAEAELAAISAQLQAIQKLRKTCREQHAPDTARWPAQVLLGPSRDRLLQLELPDVLAAEKRAQLAARHCRLGLLIECPEDFLGDCVGLGIQIVQGRHVLVDGHEVEIGIVGTTRIGINACSR